MVNIPKVVTHRYSPAIGACRNVCSLPDHEALRVIDRLRCEFRPTLKPDYLVRRRRTEDWLSKAACAALGRRFEGLPAYFFLGDFSDRDDPSRPASLVLPLSHLPSGAISFTLGDSMSVAEQADPRIYKLDQILSIFLTDDSIATFGVSDQLGFHKDFIEVQVWERSWLSAHHFDAPPLHRN